MAPKKQRTLPAWLSPLVGIVAIAGIVIYVLIERVSLMQAIKALDGKTLVLFVLLAVMFQFLNGMSLLLFTRALDVKIGIIEAVGIALATSFANYLGPLSAGLVVRAGYLKTKHDFPYTRFVSITAASYLVTILSASLLGVVILLAQWPSLETGTTFLLMMFGGTSGICILMAVLPFRPAWFEPIPIIGMKLAQSIEGWQTLKKEPILILEQIIITFLFHICNGILLFLALKATNNYVPLFVAISLGIFLSLSLIFRIVPGNLGIQEFAIAAVVSLTHVPPEAGISAALVIRIAQILVVFPGGALASYLLTRATVRYRGKAS